VNHLSELGIPTDVEDVVTSAHAAAAMVAEITPAGSTVLVVGGEGLTQAVRDHGLRPVTSCDDNPVAVVQGLGPAVGWELLAEGTYAVRSGLPWVASNLDVTVPTSRGLAPGNGALVSVIALATGRHPVSAGKPEIALHREATRRVGAESPLVVGDRLDSDIQGANRAQMPSLLVLTGVTTAADLVLAVPIQRPTYVAADLLSGLESPHPGVLRASASRWSCGSWVCDVRAGEVVLAGEGPALDAVRALSVACWDEPAAVEPREVHRVLERLG
ncbi:MAG: HAD hydrolase-like protein, partial [Ornithinimicrobium sp.]